ncbi:unnamed protein product [Enterobius vermicularis]|uniref:Rab-GAP TBC domain-containing protein n=1 Tax=Enterobius vermicularis TaxID=51028 RepID=A0A0N4VC37_ENTVE|nr:unnamed protein product [Enterobius vermicularis]
MRSFLTEHRGCLHLYINELRQFATSPGGLVSDEIRAVIWPILEACPEDDLLSAPSVSDSDFESARSSFSDGEEDDPLTPTIESKVTSLSDLKRHVEWGQVELDVNRTLARFPPNISEGRRKELQDELTPLVVRILHECPQFHYYQGFHDVCLTLLLVLGAESAERVGRKLARYGSFKWYLSQTLEDSVLKELSLMYIMLWKEDSELEHAMRSVQLGALFALSWPLTWFSHALHHYEQVVVCFDLFLAAHPLMPVYLTSAFVLWRGSALLTRPREMPMYHHFLNNMPDEIPIEALISDAQALYRMMPPVTLRGSLFERYHSFLVLKAERTPLPKTSFSKWLAAGTATAALYLISRYWLF